MSEPDMPQPKNNFWDSMTGLVLLVAVILLARYYILEPYKIPSGSMEPTLFGHEDYGDRIVTNKLAFAPKQQVLLVIGGSVVLIALCFFMSKAWLRKKAIVFWILTLLAVPGGLFVAMQKEAVASEPHRFDVTVFNFNSEWNGQLPNQKINYIKRLWGLPGDEIRISGGDIFLKKHGDYEIVRKPAELQDTFWYPVAYSWPKQVNPDLSEADKKKLRFPWHGADDGVAGVKQLDNHLELDGSAPVKLEYQHPVTNIYLKQGRWPFQHKGCPAVKDQGEKRDANGILWRSPDALTEDITAYVANTWQGVECPNCKQLLFPITPDLNADDPHIIENNRGTNFFYGGKYIVGDIRVDLGLDVVTPGSLTLEVGSNRHRAVWALGTTAPEAEGAHNVKAAAALTPGKHTLSLAYVDATVIATLDGKEIERQELKLDPLGPKYAGLASMAQLSFTGFKGSVTQLDLFRDFFYSSQTGSGLSPHDNTRRGIEPDGSMDYWAKLPQDTFLMLGDNSPSSLDGRVWGFVPRSELIGRAGVVWWPPSRWRVIK